MYAPAIAKCLQENLSTSDLLPVSNKQMSNTYESIGFCKEEAKTFAQLLLHWDHVLNNGRPIKIPFFWRQKFPLGCDGHVSKFPIQSLYYSWFDVDGAVKNKLKWGLSWSVLLSTTSTRHYPFPKHFILTYCVFLHVERVCQSFWKESLTRTSSSFA